MPDKTEKRLRRGWTTGACATAAARAAACALLKGSFPDPVEIRLPKGQRPRFSLALRERGTDFARAGVIKDAGDDPDVTHGALIIVTLRRGAPESGTTFEAGEGVGRVTLPGLPLEVGEPAINPMPRQMIRETLAEVAAAHNSPADFQVEISIPGGEKLAHKTWNPRLGILGGLSILGTTGIVVPYSCSAWIHSIHRGIDVARASGQDHVVGCTGSTSEAAVQKIYDLPETAYLDMGDFVGGLLKYLAAHPLPRLTIGGGFAKLCKLAQGAMDLHSGRSQVDFDALARALAELGASEPLKEEARNANTANQVLALAEAAGLALGDHVAEGARQVAQTRLPDDCRVEVLVFDRSGRQVGRAP
jgi:cobalt-precorrin-5B (C1)-methyltransferase